MPMIPGGQPAQVAGGGNAIQILQWLEAREARARDAAFRQSQIEIQQRELAQRDRELGLREENQKATISLGEAQKKLAGAQARKFDADAAATERDTKNQNLAAGGISKLGVRLALSQGRSEEEAMEIGRALLGVDESLRLDSIADKPELRVAINEVLESTTGISERTRQEAMVQEFQRKALSHAQEVFTAQQQAALVEQRSVQLKADLAQAIDEGRAVAGLANEVVGIENDLNSILKTLREMNTLGGDQLAAFAAGEGDMATIAPTMKELAKISARLQSERDSLTSALVRAVGKTSQVGAATRRGQSVDPETGEPVTTTEEVVSEYGKTGLPIPSSPDLEEVLDRHGLRLGGETPTVVQPGPDTIQAIGDSILDSIQGQEQLGNVRATDATLQSWMDSVQAQSMPDKDRLAVVQYVKSKSRKQATGTVSSTRNRR